MPSAQVQPAGIATGDARVTLVDTDIHPMMLAPALESRLSESWWRRYEDFGVRVAPPPAIYPRVRNSGYRTDAWPEGGFPGSDLGLLRRQLLDEHDVQYGTLNPLQGQVWGADAPELAAVLCRTLNDWILEEWLEPEPRLLGSICVPFEHPELAVREIERRAGDGRFVHVLLPASAEAPLGSRRYWRIYAAAVEAGLPVAIHTGGIEQHRGAGWPSYYLEEHLWNGNVMAAGTISMVCEGVFEQFPTLRVVLQETGISWGAATMWALDAAWEQLREELPHLQRPPSEYFREHFWFTTQPIEEPEDPEHLARAFEHMGMGDHIMFATDYPHWDFDSPKQALPRSLSPDLRESILAGNACRLYGLPRDG
jgi:predicted TIM-barrel fold metal-dependent hydrolase